MMPYVEALLQVAVEAADSGLVREAATLLRLMIGRCGPRESDALALLGQVTRGTGDLIAAEWLLQQALAIHPEHAWAHAELGETLRLAGRPKEAVPHLEKAVALNPALTAAPAALAAAYAALDQHADALRWARTALAHNEARPDAHGLMGDVLARQGRATEAIAEYDKAIVLRKRESRALYGRGLARLELGDMPGGWADHEARLDLTGTGGFVATSVARAKANQAAHDPAACGTWPCRYDPVRPLCVTRGEDGPQSGVAGAARAWPALRDRPRR